MVQQIRNLREAEKCGTFKMTYLSYVEVILLNA